jgi:hypothetical protein
MYLYIGSCIGSYRGQRWMPVAYKIETRKAYTVQTLILPSSEGDSPVLSRMITLFLRGLCGIRVLKALMIGFSLLITTGPGSPIRFGLARCSRFGTDAGREGWGARGMAFIVVTRPA